jgi:hypothetical protein
MEWCYAGIFFFLSRLDLSAAMERLELAPVNARSFVGTVEFLNN